MRLNIATKSGQGVTPQVTAERLVNMYTEQTEGKSSVVVHGSPGLSLFATCGNGPIRGIETHKGVLCVVSGPYLYTVNSVGVATNIGTISSTGNVGMSSNGTNLCIVTGVGNPGYLFDGTTLSTITDTDFGGADTVDVLDGFFVFGDGTESFFINTTPFDGSNYDALDFASAESNPDKILRPFVDHRELLLFGSETLEGWYNSGDADFTFERTPGAIAEKGIASKWAVARIDNTVFWLDQHGVARRMADGYGTIRISTHEVESSFGTFSTAEAMAFTHHGHEFFVLTFDNGTWVYDAATGLWHERESWEESFWRARHHEFLYNKNLVGDFENGNVYSVADGVYQENGALLVSEMIFPPINMDGKKFRLSSLQLDLEQGSAGDVRLWLSNDGETWRSAGVRSMGAVGDTDARTIWRSLGQHRNLHLKFSFSDNVRKAVFAAYATLS